MAFCSRTVLHLVHRLTFGGAERVLVNYLNGSQKHRHVIGSFFPADSFADEINNSEVSLVNLDKRVGNDLRIPFRLAAICRKFDVDVIHCQGWGTYLEGLLCAGVLQRRTKFVFAFHGKTISDLGPLPRRRKLVQRLGSFLGDGVITPSEEMKRDYAREIGIDSKKITVIHNGVDTDLFSPATDDKSVRREFGIGPDEVVIGSVARLDPVKNFPGLLRTFFMAVEKGLSARLLIVGDGPQMKELRILAGKIGCAGSILFAGRRSDVPQCLRAMDIYVQPSFYEGFSMTILEALSTGLPVIAYNVGGTYEMVRDGYNGMLLNDQENNTLAQAMLQLARNPPRRQAMGRKGRALIKENFSLAGMIRQYDRLFSFSSEGDNPA